MTGFYKQDESGEILHAPNFVYGAAYELLKESHAEHEYPVDGWYWFNSETEADRFFADSQLQEQIDGLIILQAQE
jgi:hypothetical protein